MKSPRFLLVCLALLSTLWMSVAHALPTVDQVQAAAKSGDYAGAEKMMREVVTARPDSARAHYVLAEILAHQRQFDEAAQHTRRARALDPSIKFTDAAKFNAFEQLLQREQVSAAKPVAPTPLDPSPAPRAAPVPRAEPQSMGGGGGGVPVWLLAVGAIAFIAIAASWMRRRTAAQAQPVMSGGYAQGGYGAAGGYGQGGYGGGYGVPQQPASGGSGMLGVGLGVAGGVAAGMLAERLLHGDRSDHGSSLPSNADAGSHAGGMLPGAFGGGGDPGAADELTRRDIDFGGGDGWGGGGSDAGGGGDFGGGGSDDW